MQTDIAVIGAGFAGLAARLAEVPLGHAVPAVQAGTMEGAVVCGNRAAQQVAERLGSG